MGFFYLVYNGHNSLNLSQDNDAVFYISSGYLQLILLPLIMVGQNLQGRHAELRAEHDYETNIKAEKEVEAILLHLEKQDETMMEILKRIESLEKERK